MIKSRTFWIVVADVIFNVLSIFGNIIPQDYIVAGNAFLGMMSIYFHINPSQSYSKKIEDKIREEVKQDGFIEGAEDHDNINQK